MAEKEGFEPSVPVKVHLLSRQAHSTTLAPLLFSATVHLANHISRAQVLDLRAACVLFNGVRRVDQMRV